MKPMLCIDDTQRFLKYCRTQPILVSPKLDGVRTLACVDFDRATIDYYSRSGKLFPNFKVFDKGIWDMAGVLPKYQGQVWLDGEVTSVDATFRGVMQQLRRLHEADPSVFRFNLFDFAVESWSLEYRQEKLQEAFCRAILSGNGGNLSVIPHNIITKEPWQSWEELFSNTLNCYVMAGYEGAVLKGAHSPYEQKRSPYWLKLKMTRTVDLPVLQAVFGKGKHQGKLGSLTCEFNGRFVDVGTGFSDAERIEFLIHMPKMIEVQYQEVTPDGSLRHPRFIRVREDK